MNGDPEKLEAGTRVRGGDSPYPSVLAKLVSSLLYALANLRRAVRLKVRVPRRAAYILGTDNEPNLLARGKVALNLRTFFFFSNREGKHQPIPLARARRKTFINSGHLYQQSYRRSTPRVEQRATYYTYA